MCQDNTVCVPEERYCTTYPCYPSQVKCVSKCEAAKYHSQLSNTYNPIMPHVEYKWVAPFNDSYLKL